MKPYYETDGAQLYLGDCLKVLADMPDASVDSMVTDPPAGIAFMGRAWDEDKGGRRQWIAWLTEVMEQAYRVLKPGGHALVWALPRTSHWTATALEDAGFEIRDCVTHLFGSGWPKSQGVLKPSSEHWWLVRKPLVGTIAGNVQAYGTGALNIDACRVAHNEPAGKSYQGMHGRSGGILGATVERHRETDAASTAGRWPTNAVFTHSASCVEGQACQASCPVGDLDRQSGQLTSGGRSWTDGDRDTEAWRRAEGRTDIATRSAYQRTGDTGGASRYFPVFRYQAKAPTSERPKVGGIAHPTSKSLGLMKFLCRLVTQPGGIVLDPFAGSGTTLEAALAEGFQVIGIEQEPDYLPLIMSRLSKPVQTGLFGGVL